MNIKRIFLKINRMCPKLLSWMSDEQNVKFMYRLHLEKTLNLENPKTFNEKLQWLKLYDRKDIYSIMVDKYRVKEYVANIIGKEYIIPTLGVWDHYDDIDFNVLPEKFVLKCTHDSGGLVICKNKSELGLKTKCKIERSLRRNYYWIAREWPYKTVKPRIIAEQYMTDGESDLNDYKFFCFNGKVKCFKIDFDRFANHKANYYDIEMNLLPFGERVCPPDFERHFDKTENFEKMVQLAEKLAEGSRFLRVDFYNMNGNIYFGELTFYPNSGLGKFTDDKWDYILGSWISLQ